MTKVSHFLIALFLMAVSSAHGHDKRPDFNVNEAIRKSDLIFLGRVTDIGYANSKGDARLESLPHTFVTYQIHQLIKGNPRQANSNITLRFLGGRGTEAQFFHPANYPLFDTGDMDVVFVRKNTVNSCPLYQCATSRFRAINDLIFNERSQQVLLTQRQQIAFGRFQPMNDILSHRISQTIIKAVPTKLESEGPPESELPIGRQFTLQALVQFLDAKVRPIYPPDVMSQLPIVPSANIQTTFTIRPLRPAKPRTPRQEIVRPEQMPTPEDLEEEQELMKNDYNPVFKR